MEHANSSDHKYEMEAPSLSEHGHNPSCGDDIVVSVKLDGDIIEDIAFTGTGCAISQASTSLMCEQLQGKTIEEALKTSEAFISMIKDAREVDDELEDMLGDATALQNIAFMPQRVKCAVLAWHTLNEMLQNKNE